MPQIPPLKVLLFEPGSDAISQTQSNSPVNKRLGPLEQIGIEGKEGVERIVEKGAADAADAADAAVGEHALVGGELGAGGQREAAVGVEDGVAVGELVGVGEAAELAADGGQAVLEGVEGRGDEGAELREPGRGRAGGEQLPVAEDEDVEEGLAQGVEGAVGGEDGRRLAVALGRVGVEPGRDELEGGRARGGGDGLGARQE